MISHVFVSQDIDQKWILLWSASHTLQNSDILRFRDFCSINNYKQSINCWFASLWILATTVLHKAQKIVHSFKKYHSNSLFKSLYKTPPETVSSLKGIVTGENTCGTSFTFLPKNSIINTRSEFAESVLTGVISYWHMHKLWGEKHYPVTV